MLKLYHIDQSSQVKLHTKEQHTHACAHARTHTHTLAHLHTRTLTHVACTHTQTAYTHTHTYTHTCARDTHTHTAQWLIQTKSKMIQVWKKFHQIRWVCVCVLVRVSEWLVGSMSFFLSVCVCLDVGEFEMHVKSVWYVRLKILATLSVSWFVRECLEPLYVCFSVHYCSCLCVGVKRIVGVNGSVVTGLHWHNPLLRQHALHARTLTTHTHTRTRTHAHKNTHSPHAHTHARTHTHTHLHTHLPNHTHTHTHTHTLTHTGGPLDLAHSQHWSKGGESFQERRKQQVGRGLCQCNPVTTLPFTPTMRLKLKEILMHTDDDTHIITHLYYSLTRSSLPHTSPKL